jgi:LacI family transcriptional regulator
MPSVRPAPALKDIARETGLAVSTVSYALRGSPKVPSATATRIHEVAQRLGYRPNARVAELMAQVRRGGGPRTRDRLALVAVEAGALRGPGLDAAEGARARAAERGYELERFTLTEAGGHPGRLADILRARNIPGVVFAPVFNRARVDFAWPWERFAMAVIGAADWGVPLSRAAHHHYEAMRLTLEGLADTGAKRPAAWLNALTNERAHRGWQAAWLAYGPAAAARRLWLRAEEPNDAELAGWLGRLQPDALVVDGGASVARLKAAGWRGPVANLDLRPRSGAMGVDQAYDIIAAHAVDLVVAQLQRNERGPPAPPRALLFPGRWVAPATENPRA